MYRNGEIWGEIKKFNFKNELKNRFPNFELSTLKAISKNVYLKSHLS